MADTNEPFLIGRDVTKLEDVEPGSHRFKHSTSDLRRRFRRRKGEESKGVDDEKKGDAKSATEDFKEIESSMPNQPSSSSRLYETSLKTQLIDGNKQEHKRFSMSKMNNSSYIRRPPDDKLREIFKNKVRGVADGVPEVHFIGEVVEGVGFKDTFVSCKLYLEWGKAWSFLEGEESTQTQYAASDDGVQVWNHPIDVHFASASIQGWPRIVLQVWELDEFGRSILSGYGFVHMPTDPGYHELDVHCWRPSGSMIEEIQSFFLGTSTCLVNEDIVFGKAWEMRSQLKTVSSGIVKLHITVLLRFFNEQNVA